MTRYGWIPEWPKGTDCKSAANCFGGSNPPPSISRKALADVAQLAEQLICNQQVIGSSPIIGFIQFNIELYYGQIPEWPKGTDCKSAATCFGGSNPPPSIELHKKLCRSGGTGRRPGLKIPWVVIPVPVRFRSAAVVEEKRNVEDTAFLFFDLQEIAFLQIKNTLPKA